MALNDYKRTNVKSGIMWVGKTDFHKGRELHPSVYYYKKGWIRDYEDKHVIKVYDTYNQIGGDKLKGFDTKSQAIRFAMNFMRKH